MPPAARGTPIEAPAARNESAVDARDACGPDFIV
jgi:hypothetical protein